MDTADRIKSISLFLKRDGGAGPPTSSKKRRACYSRRPHLSELMDSDMLTAVVSNGEVVPGFDDGARSVPITYIVDVRLLYRLAVAEEDSVTEKYLISRNSDDAFEEIYSVRVSDDDDVAVLRL